MTPYIQSLGGLALASKVPPKRCPRCYADFRSRSWYSWLAHKGLHGLADRYFGGSLAKAAERLARNGLAKQDPAPWNGAFKHKPIKPFIPKETQVKTDFTKIKFDADKHRYFLNGRELTSVTTKIKEFQKPFDREGQARRTAEKKGLTVASVLAEWDASWERARRLGTAVHEHIQKTLMGDGSGQLGLDPFMSLNTLLPEIVSFNRFWSQLAPMVNYCKEHIEWVVGDDELGIAGMVDTMLFRPDTGKYHIWDWKTGKFDLNNNWENLLPPFGYLDASKLHIYSLQVSLYRLIIERNTGLDFGDSYLVHLTPEGHQVYRAVDLREKLLMALELETA
jgi:ATP-dependent exoDNAse (exonuclease V) beta subunit